MQNIRDVNAEFGEPAVFGAVGLAACKYDRVILIHRKQAFAAAGGAEH
jgi:hypothetical protein